MRPKHCLHFSICVSSLRRGHANLLCIVPILTDDPRKESNRMKTAKDIVSRCLCPPAQATHPTTEEQTNKTATLDLREHPRTCNKKLVSLLDLCVSSLRRGHANLLCIVPILTDDPRKESNRMKLPKILSQDVYAPPAQVTNPTTEEQTNKTVTPDLRERPRMCNKKTCITSRLVRVILAQGPC